MPIFQDDLEHDDRRGSIDSEPGLITIEQPISTLRRLSEESLRTELCEGPVPDSPRHSPPQKIDDEDIAISSRAELIERLKRGESPTWIPNRRVRLEPIFPTDSSPKDKPKTSRTSSGSSSLLPAAQITPEKKEPTSPVDVRLRDGLDIERPRSALHSGDFTHDEADDGHRSGDHEGRRSELLRRGIDNPWVATSPPRDFTPFSFDHARDALHDGPYGPRSYGTSPLSSSFTSSFAYQPPTSPLVQSESNEELELPEPLGNMDFSGRIGARRHTLFSNFSTPYTPPSYRHSLSTRGPLHRREGSLPYQAHQPRRSLNSTPSFIQSGLGTSPQTPALFRSRRPSFGSDSSPRQHASMVGSYEESILRGRMSTTPSKPLDFLAQIGVLGMGKCKSSLRCPPHVTLPFPAVYYSYSSTAHGRSRAEDGPSPYVGQIDLENGLPNQADESRLKRKAQSRYADRKAQDAGLDTSMMNHGLERETRRLSIPKRVSTSPRTPPGGSYRIPEKGQIQIIVKNQNKTAVKLFLVPYDLAGMEPGTKTFVRQRSYSAGPIIDGIPNSTELDALDRPILRYLLHLHICCPSKGRYYLYKSIRIVFANRVPDGKEKLRNEITWPEPRFTPYKPIRVMHPPLSTTGSGGAGAALAADKAFRRRSSGFPFARSAQAYDAMDGVYPSGLSSAGFGNGNTLPLDPIPFRLPARDRLDGSSNDDNDESNSNSDGVALAGTGFRSPGEESTSQASRPSTKDSLISAAGLPWEATSYAKLSKGDLGYGGNAFSPLPGASPGGTEGLLSQRLRSLGVKPLPPPTGSEDQDV